PERRDRGVVSADCPSARLLEPGIEGGRVSYAVQVERGSGREQVVRIHGIGRREGRDADEGTGRFVDVTKCRGAVLQAVADEAEGAKHFPELPVGHVGSRHVLHITRSCAQGWHFPVITSRYSPGTGWWTVSGSNAALMARNNGTTSASGYPTPRSSK